MKVKNCVFIGLFIMASSLVFTQEAVLCALQNDYIKIESTADIPTVTSNPDSTVTLTHQDQNITAIFSQHIIYDFYQAYPNANPEGELIKYYIIVHGNKALINALYNTVSPDVFFIDYDYEYLPIPTNLINLLDEKVYKLIKYCSDVPEVGEICENNEQNVPDGFNLKIAFNYDSNTDIILAETVNLSSCGNKFAIGLKGGFDDGSGGSLDNILQLWQSDLGTSTETNYSDPCHSIEAMLYSMLDIGCLEFNYGNLKVNLGTSAGQIILERENGTFSTDFMTFEEDNLSVEESLLYTVRFFEINDYLNIPNQNENSFSIEILNVTGKQILKSKPFQNNTINVSTFSSGLYFIRVSTLNNQQKIFKFLKN